MDVMRLAAEERADFTSLLASLRADEWSHPSLCAGWRVRDVAAHAISYDVLTPVGTLLRFMRGGLSVDRINERGVEKAKDLSPAQIVAQYRGHQRPRGLTALMGGGIALTDGLIHQQDIRRPLNRHRQIPGERLRAALPFALKAPTLSARKLTAGLTLVATDLDWRSGSGPEVRGSGEALLMASAGRAVAVDELTGAGVELLHARL